MNTANIIQTPVLNSLEKRLIAATTYRVPSFNVIEHGERIPTVEHCFIEHMLLFCPDPPIVLRAKNNAVYTAVYDNLTLPTNDQCATIKVIVSFQKHTYGSFAVVRNYKEKKE